MKQFLKFLLILLPALGGAGGGLYAQKPVSPAGRQGQALVDSLLKELPKAKEDTSKVNLLNDLSNTYSGINPDDGIKYGTQGLELAIKLDWKKGEADACNRIAGNYGAKSDNPKALEYYQKALKMDEEIAYKKGIAAVTCNIGIIYHAQSDYPKALEYYQKALKMDEEIGNKQYMANVTGNIGSVYEYQSDYPKALEYDFKALKMHEETGNKIGLANVASNIGGVYQSQDDFPKALEYDFKALKIDEEIGNKNGIARVTGNIGVVYKRQNDFPKALEYYFKALKMNEEIGNKSGVANNTGRIGNVYALQKNYTMSIEFAQTALKIMEEIGDKRGGAAQLGNIGTTYISLVTDTFHTNAVMASNEIRLEKYKANGDIPEDKTARLSKAISYLQKSLAIGEEIHSLDVLQSSYQNLAEAYKLNGDYKQSLECYKNYIAIKDSVFSNEKSKEIAKMEYNRIRQADSFKSVDIKNMADLKLQHQRNYTYLGFAVIALLLGFSFFIVKERGKSEHERKKSDNLLLNILPEEVASQLKKTGTTTAKHYDDVTVLFTDFVNFTSAGERMAPQALIEELNTCFKAFDEITGKHHIEKIKTIGDAYLAVAGLPTADPKHAENTVRAAIEINHYMQDRLAKLGDRTFDIRIGIHSGSVVAGIVGLKKFAYNIWGDTVNTAARMEQNSEPGKINISETTYELVKDKIACEYRGEIEAKGKGGLKMYYIG